MTARRIIVVGGGISGLAAAFTAAREIRAGGAPAEVLVLERDAAPGGKVRTVREDGWLVEEGPTAYLDNEPVVDELAAAVGLDGARIRANAAAAHRFVVRGGRLREIPLHPLKFARSGILGPLGLLRIGAEPFIRGKRDDTDETVWQFARRRLGPQAADRLIAPMVIGVFAGDAKRLSLPAAFPRMAALEREHGSLIRGMIRRKRAGKGGGPGGPSGVLSSFTEGLGALPRALAASDGVTLRCGAAVEAVVPAADGVGWRVVVAGAAEAIPADTVVLSGEAWSMADLVREHAPDLAAPLDTITYPHVSVVALGFGPEALAQVPNGFGVLIPRGEGYRILGVLWDSRFFPGRSPDENHLLMRIMVGGAVDDGARDLDEDALVALVREEVTRLFGLTVTPVYTRVARWDRAIPQYELGHLERVAAIDTALARRPGLLFAGNALHGIAFGKAAAAGVAAGKEAATPQKRGLTPT